MSRIATRPNRRRRSFRLEALEGRACPSTFPVTSLLDTPDPGTLRWAITQADQATDDASITFAVTGTITLDSALPDLSKPTGTLTIAGPGASSLTIARSAAAGTPSFRIFTVDVGVHVEISGLTVSGGYTPGGTGGGIYNAGTMRLADSTVSGNTALNDGGIYNGGTATLTDSTVSGNTAYDDGGIFNSETAALILMNSTVSGNTSSYASGGIYNGGTVTLIDSTVNGNGAGGDGGGVFNAGTATLINSTVGGNSSRGYGGGIFNAGTASLKLMNSTLSGNYMEAFGLGGGIYNGGMAILTDSTVSGNFAFWGGAIANADSATATLVDSTVSGNGATDGGGIFNYGMATLTDSTVSDNGANGGGGIENFGTMRLADSTVSRNVAQYGGGGIANLGTTTLTDSTVSGNGAAVGGGILNSGIATLTDSTVSGNSAYYDGGGIFNLGGATQTLTLTNSTVSGNKARGLGGGIYLEPSPTPGTVSLLNSILAGNSAAGSKDGFGAFTSLGHNLIGDTAGSTGWVGSDLQNVDPLLGPLADNGGPTKTMALLPGSRAIDNGVAVPGVTTDQRGVSRLINGPPDIGAFEAVKPGDITSQVHIAPGGFQYNRPTHQFVESVTITNTSGAALVEPLVLALQHLTPGVTLVNATGVARDGSPEIAVTPPALGELLPGQSVSLMLVFADPSLVQIAYVPHLLATPAPASDVTAQASITLGGFTYDRTTGHFLESVRITNTSNAAFVGPLALALDGLPAGVGLFNASGATSATSPAGSPYVNLPTAGGLQPGQSVTVVLVFVDPGVVQIGFHARLLDGPGPY